MDPEEINGTEFDVESGQYLDPNMAAVAAGSDLPDEEDVVEPKAKAVADDSDELELEIVDDTPPADRDRKPLPDEVVQELEADDSAEEYSAAVQQRINKLKKAWHDERRAKETAMREREAAAQMTKQIMDERNQLRTALSNGEGWAIAEAKRRAELELANAKGAYKAAYENGDPDEVANAQEALSRATSRFDQANALAPRYAGLQPEETDYNQAISQAAAAQPQPQVDDKAVEWGQKNDWFGNDDEMTSFALGVHQTLVKSGVHPQSDEYYERVDARMREVFPAKFGAKPAEDGETKQPKRQPSTVVAPAGRAPKGKKVVLKQSQVAVARSLGISPEAYAKELMKMGEL